MKVVCRDLFKKVVRQETEAFAKKLHRESSKSESVEELMVQILLDKLAHNTNELLHWYWKYMNTFPKMGTGFKNENPIP